MNQYTPPTDIARELWCFWVDEYGYRTDGDAGRGFRVCGYADSVWLHSRLSIASIRRAIVEAMGTERVEQYSKRTIDQWARDVYHWATSDSTSNTETKPCTTT